MLSVVLKTNEYVTIGNDIVVSISGMSKGHCYLGIEADRSIPIVRGTVLERNGTPPPACLTDRPPRKKPKYRSDAVYYWTEDREYAARAMKKVVDQLEKDGAEKEARMLRMQLDLLIPAVWEDE